MSFSSYSKSILFTIMVLVLASCASKKSTVADKTTRLRFDIVDYGKKHLHKPYQYGGRGPNSFDCSGYTSFVFAKFGFNLHDSSAGQARQGITINKKDELEIGDLVFFEGRSRNGRIGHVGIVSDIRRHGKFSFIHASTSNGVIITSSNDPYYQERYLRGGRIIKDIPKRTEAPNTDERAIAETTYIKAQEHIVYKETEDGFVAINTKTGKPVEGELTVSAEQSPKPVKSKKPEDEKKDKSEISKAVIRGSEEELLTTAPNRITYKVKPGETLYSISKKHNCSVEQLKKWNPDIENNMIEAGDELDVYQ